MSGTYHYYYYYHFWQLLCDQISSFNVFKFAFPGKFLQNNRNVRDYEVLTNLPICLLSPAPGPRCDLFFAILCNLFFVNIVDLFFLIFFGKYFYLIFLQLIFFCYSLQLILGQSFRIIFLANHVNLFFWYFLQQFFPLIFLQIFTEPRGKFTDPFDLVLTWGIDSTGTENVESFV